jgi:guanine deaminase
VGRNRYAVIPRFSLSCDEPLLESCASLLASVDGSLLTSHINEHPAEMSLVSELFGGCDYLETYERYGLVGAGNCARAQPAPDR